MISSLFIKYKFYSKTPRRFYYAENYGFKNGSFSIDFYELSGGIHNYSFFYDSYRNFSDVFSRYINEEDPCKIDEYNHTNFTVNGTSSYTVDGSIDETGVYYFIIYACNDSAAAAANITATYTNVDTDLDTREVGNLIFIPILLVVSVILLISWIVMSILVKHSNTLSNLIICMVYFSYTVYIAFVLVYYNLRNKKMSVEAVLVFVELSRAVMYPFALYALFFLCSGFTFSEDRPRWYVYAAFAPYCWLPYIISCFNVGLLISLVLFIAWFFGFFYVVDKVIKKVRSYLLAQMMQIRESGIRPDTTPAYKRYSTFLSLEQFSMISVAVLCVLQITITYGYIVTLYAQILSNLLLLFILIVIGYFFIPTPSYETPGEGVDETYLEDLNSNYKQIKDLVKGDGMEAWKPGTPYPGVPKPTKGSYSLL